MNERCSECEKLIETHEDEMAMFNVRTCAKCEAEMFRAMEAERVKEEVF